MAATHYVLGKHPSESTLCTCEIGKNHSARDGIVFVSETPHQTPTPTKNGDPS
jgi:hypothetical protein